MHVLFMGNVTDSQRQRIINLINFFIEFFDRFPNLFKTFEGNALRTFPDKKPCM
jgi:hypothetical protein